MEGWQKTEYLENKTSDLLCAELVFLTCDPSEVWTESGKGPNGLESAILTTRPQRPEK